MDIEYLLWLQNFRNAINDALTPFMEWISHFAVMYLLMVPVFVYWCISKRKGLYVLASTVLSLAVNSVVKLTACIYRPWIKDPRVVPAGDAITEATGYSFPSGHVATATPIYGGLAHAFKKRWLTWICVALILITAFSRNYLGVHTLQDVLAGLMIGIGSLYLMQKIFDYLDVHPEREDVLLFFGFAFGISAIFYITFKQYPTEYVNGELLVDPHRMMKDGYKDIGQFVAFCAARFLEKRFVRFKETGLNKKGIILALFGAFVLFLLSQYVPKLLANYLETNICAMVSQMLIAFFIVLLWPAVIRLFQKEKPVDDSLDEIDGTR